MTGVIKIHLCSVPGCERKSHSRGWCQKHYHLWNRHGDPMVRTRPEYGSTVEEKFRYFMPGEPPRDGSCWEWSGTKTYKGYGEIRGEGRKKFRAHRVAYRIFKGEEPGPVLRHTCDNPPCCNPEHLIQGTPQDNSQDMVDRGRSPRGEKNSFSRLTEEDVLEMRRLRGLGAKQASLAAMFGVSQPTISAIVNRKTWRHLS